MSERAYRANDPSRARVREEVTTFTAEGIVSFPGCSMRDPGVRIVGVSTGPARAMSPISQRLVDLGRMLAPTADELEAAAAQRQRLIDDGLLRPCRDDGLVSFQLPRAWPVLRLDERSKARARLEAWS